jgi:hypothetical protein
MKRAIVCSHRLYSSRCEGAKNLRDGRSLLTDMEQAKAQLLQVAQNLLIIGMESRQVTQLLGLSEAQIKAL